MNMLRYVIGDEKFFKTLKDYAQQDAWKSVNTDDFRRSRKPCPGRTWAISSSSGSNPAARPSSSWNTPSSAPQKGFRVMGKICAGPGYVPHAGGPEDRDRRQSRREARGSGRHLIGVLGRYVRQAEERGHRPQQPRAALQPPGARGGGHPPRRAVRRIERIRRGDQGISEGARNQPHTVRWRTTASPRCSSCRTTTSRRPTISAKR